MNNVYFIAKKELKTFFKSPVAYIVLVLTISIFNLFFFMLIEQNQEASLRDVFQLMEFMFIFLVPIITMRLFSEEKSAGTMEFLMTAPVTNMEIVIGKYLGVLACFSVLISMTFVYYLIIEYFGNPDKLVVLFGYLGIWLEAALFLAIGMVASTWTSNQIVAAMVSYGFLFLLYFIVNFTSYVVEAGIGSIEIVIQQLGTSTHLSNLVAGVITVGDIVYYVSGTLFCVVISRLSIENRRLWGE